MSHTIYHLSLTIACIFLTSDGIGRNWVNGASIRDTENNNAPKKSCNNICQSQICHNEAKKLDYFIDRSIDPCDDFYNFACGKAINRFESNYMISDSDTSGMYDGAQKVINNQTYMAIDNIDSNYPEAFIKMQTFYNNCINQNESIDYLLRILKNIGGLPMLAGDDWNETAYDWKEALFKIIDENVFISFPMFIRVAQDPDTSKNIPVVKSAKIDNIGFDKHHAESRDNLISESMIALGVNPRVAEKDIEAMSHFLIKLRDIKTTDDGMLSPTINQTQVSISALVQNYPSIPWLQLSNKILNRYDVYVEPSDLIIVDDWKFIKSLENLINGTPKRIIANFLAWYVIVALYPYLPEPFHQLGKRYKVYGNDTREGFCLTQLTDHFSLALGALYVRNYLAPNFHEDMKNDIENIVDNVKNQFKRNIENAEWMDNNTKAAALKKLGVMHHSVGFEKKLLDDREIDEYYSELDITTGSFLKSGITTQAFVVSNLYKNQIDSPKKINWKIRKYTDFNAHYTYELNAFDIHAVLLQWFMYSYGRPKYLNYGALGTVIGHEIMHGFDNKGRNYDESGFLNNWWLNDTKKNYLQKVQCLIDQFSNFTIPKTNFTVNGVKTQDENIADNGGFKAAYQAYSKWVEDTDNSEECLPGLHYTPKQLFWISSAATYCSNSGIEYIRNSIETDTHAPDYPRVILSFSNIKEFAEDFKCKAGSRMNPEKRCNIW